MTKVYHSETKALVRVEALNARYHRTLGDFNF